MVAFDSVLAIAVRTAVPTYAGLYEGAWAHPGVYMITIYRFWELTG